MLYLALGIIGATVMPHNLYLHSGIVQTRAYGDSLPEKREALKLRHLDSTVALMFALLVNASILILAAATFHRGGHTSVTDIGEAHSMLAPLVGSLLAPKLFAIALLCCGLNSTVTATMAGQIVMEGFLDIRLPAWARRLITRLVAIVPAAGVTLYYGAEGTGTAADPQPGHPRLPAALRHRAAGHVHPRQGQDRRPDRAGLAHAGGGHNRGDHHRAQREAVVGHRDGLIPPHLQTPVASLMRSPCKTES